MKFLLETLLFPPGINILCAALGLMLLQHRRRIATILLTASVATLYLASIPFTTEAFLPLLQTSPALSDRDIKTGGGEAIVVLGAGRRKDSPEYGGDTVSQLALERLRYGAHLQRLSGLPLILSGGATASEEGRTPEAALMKQAAENDFGIHVAAIEAQSRTTLENAINTAGLLRERHIQRVYLVTHAWHMPRALWAFQRAGIDVIPAPTGFETREDPRWRAWLPSSRALYKLNLALHEIVGMAWYRISNS